MNKTIDAQSADIEGKYQKIVSKDEEEKIIVYLKIDISLRDLRDREIKLSKDKNRAKLSFMELFRERLSLIPGKRDKISITLNVDIRDKSDIEKKTYGPFDMEIPKLSKQDMYRFMVYTLLKNKFTLLSAQEIARIGCKIIPYNKKSFMKLRMGSLRLETYLLCKQKPIKSHDKNTCVLDYVWSQVRGRRGFKTYTYDKLKNELYHYVQKPPNVSTEELINWAKTCHTNISIHAFDSTWRKFVSFTNSNTMRNVTLVYYVKDGHCYPITDRELKTLASKANQGGCDNLLKYMTDLKWTRRHDQVHKIQTLDE